MRKRRNCDCGNMHLRLLTTSTWTLDVSTERGLAEKGKRHAFATLSLCFVESGDLRRFTAGSRLKFHFPAKGTRGPVTLYWFDGPQDWTKMGRFDKFGAENATHLGRACWIVGTRGMLGGGTHAGPPAIIPGPLRKEWKANPPKQSIPPVEGGPFHEWLHAIKGTGPEPGSNFSYSAKLTEIILLGVLAQRFNTRTEWDGKNARIGNHSELNALVKEPVRRGWEYGETL